MSFTADPAGAAVNFLTYKTDALMKKKLTLTVEEKVISSARRRAKRKGVTVSKMFEEVMGSYHDEGVETDQQRDAKRLLLALEKSGSIRSKEDQKLINEHDKRKFA